MRWPGNEIRHSIFSFTISSGLWSLIGTALFLVGDAAECNLYAAFEGLCYCQLRLPQLVSHKLQHALSLKQDVQPQNFMLYSFVLDPSVKLISVVLCNIITQNYGERILAQLIGAGVMIGIAGVGSILMYWLLYIIPVQPFVRVFERYGSL